MTIDWTKPVEWVAANGSVNEVITVRREDGTYPYVLTTEYGKIHCHEDGRICISGVGYIRNVDEPKIVFPPVPERTPTLRDQFAMATLTGILTDASYRYHEDDAEKAYRIADAMLEARNAKA